jgi:hypothetical protein
MCRDPSVAKLRMSNDICTCVLYKHISWGKVVGIVNVNHPLVVGIVNVNMRGGHGAESLKGGSTMWVALGVE